jgi:biopolymer transport protein ExbD
MKIARSSRKPLVEASMVSLADIAFLIIFFFLVSSNFMKDPLAIDLPEAEKQAKTSAVTTVVVGKNPANDQVEIYLNGDPVVNADELEGRIKDIFTGFSDAGKEVQLKCDKALTYKEYSPVLTAIGNADGAIAIIHEEK